MRLRRRVALDDAKGKLLVGQPFGDRLGEFSKTAEYVVVHEASERFAHASPSNPAEELSFEHDLSRVS